MGDLSKDINSKFPTEKVKAFINIKYTSNWLSYLTEKHFSEFGISSQQYNVLRILRGAKEAITVSTVKDRMIEKTPNTTRLMDKLCDKQLIKRTRNQSDRRTVLVEVTKKGLDLIEKINIDDQGLNLGAISEEEAKTLNTILDKIRY